MIPSRRVLVAIFVGLLAAPYLALAQSIGPRFEIRFPSSVHADAITGRAFVIITKDNSKEPRFQAGEHLMGPPFFGVDVEQLRPDQPAVIDASTMGYPPRSLRDIPAGDYYVQAFISVYTRFHRADGHTIWAHNDQWEGQKVFVSPGNLYSEVQKIHLDPAGYTLNLEVTKKIPPISLPPDTQFVKRIKIQSDILTKFWGRPMYLGAVVLLPKGYDEHPDTYYPVVYDQEHFKLSAPYSFQTHPPDPNEQPLPGINFPGPEAGYELYKEWIADSFPRMILVIWCHPTPYYDDSYAVNSANNGPYGDAIMEELVPCIESRFRIIRKPYARILSGGSTGGWEALALQVYHPEFFGGAWIYYPDPIDFRRWGLVNIYEDENAFYAPALTDWQKVRRPFMRQPDGQVLLTQEEENQMEAVLGTECRSGEQTDIWFATYGPVGDDGYPKPLWDKLTGKIDHGVAGYMRDHGYDLCHYVQTNWSRIGPQLVGKLHFYVGDMDHYYLNLATYFMEDFLKTTKDPYCAATFEYGRPMKGHRRPTKVADMLRSIADELNKNVPRAHDATARKDQ